MGFYTIRFSFIIFRNYFDFKFKFSDTLFDQCSLMRVKTRKARMFHIVRAILFWNGVSIWVQVQVQGWLLLDIGWFVLFFFILLLHCRNPRGWRSDPRVVYATLSKILTCKLSQVPPHVIRIAKAKYPTSKDYMSLYNCAKTQNLTDCVDAMETTCKQKVRLLKTIRVTMELVSRLLPTFPNLKFIHLLRDPRGVMMSRLKGHVINDTVVSVTSNITCTRMYNDLIWALQLQQYYPERIKIMLYEAIAENPDKALQRMYEYTGLTLTDRVRQYVYNHTTAGLKSNGYYRTQRSNSTETAHAWRSKISWSTAKTIDASCKALYDMIGLIPFTSLGQVRNPHFKTRKTHTRMFGDFLWRLMLLQVGIQSAADY